jgi:CRISPR-associated endonuclease/helicase Cas3
MVQALAALRGRRREVMSWGNAYFWAKTTQDGQPGISVRDHGINVGCVAEALREALPPAVGALLPPGGITLAALHDVGKISAGFLCKCPAWLVGSGLAEAARNEFWQGAEADHSLVSQFCLQDALKLRKSELWAVAAGAHHGRIHGRRIAGIRLPPVARAKLEEAARQRTIAELEAIFGPLPAQSPMGDCSDLWLLAGLVAVADWIGSNENFFPCGQGVPLNEARQRAGKSLSDINWCGGKMRPETPFGEMFGIPSGPNALQSALLACAVQPGLFIVEGPMGCGKTEAALAAAHRLATNSHNRGLYFGLPTQITSSRIHRRVSRFLTKTLADPANLRLAHAASWLDEKQAVEIRPAMPGDADSATQAADARSWFASSRHALLARYGVGTVDQALQAVVAVKHFFVRRFGLAGKVVILDEVHSYDVYTGALIGELVRELLALRCSVIVLSATLTRSRRRQILAKAGGSETVSASELNPASDPYPLITISAAGQASRSVPVSWADQKQVQVSARAFSEPEIIGQCLKRAEAGQRVLYLRNTVGEAQASYRAFANAARAGTIDLGLLHSRFPFFRREQLEEVWLGRLGKDGLEDGAGCILVATQVVEQSVDIDLDFIVSDLAPTDMLLQRMGRLWRHSRARRRAAKPDFWINVPHFGGNDSARQLKSALGKSARVYAPYVLLRTAEVFALRGSLSLPAQIREVLEETYAEREAGREPDGWQQLREELEKEKRQLEDEAQAAARVLGRPSQTDREEVLTRRAGAPTRPVVLLRSCDAMGGRLTGLDGTTVAVPAGRWTHATARALHRNLVRAPAHEVPLQEAPAWLSLHVPGQPAWAVVQVDGSCTFPEASKASPLAYDAAVGLHADSNKPKPQIPDDDEFDS